MKRSDDEKEMMSYLLGELEGDDQRRVEERMFASDEYFNLLLVAENDLIDDYVKSELSAGERKRFETHFLSTPERRERLKFAMAFRDYIVGPLPSPLPAPKPLFSAPALRLAAALVIIVTIGFVIWWILSPTREMSKGMAALNKAYPEQRPTEARITEWNYAPPAPVTRGDGQGKFDYVARDYAESLIRQEVAAHPDARSYHDLGRLYLAKHEYDQAIDQFDKALKLDENNARLHSDMGAALLEKANAEQTGNATGNNLETFARSLEHLSRALELDGSLLEPLFNRALCKESMRLDREAEKDWDSYLDLDKDANSKWAAEARERLKELRERIRHTSRNREEIFQDFLEAHKARDDGRAWNLICQNRSQSESFIENRLINDYFDLSDKGLNDKANESLEVLSYAGEVERQHAGDIFISDLARFYKSATPPQLAKVRQARGLANSGRENLQKSNFNAAIEFYGGAKEAFEGAGDTYEAMPADYLIGNCYLQQSKAETGLSFFEPLARDCEKANYKWLLAQTLAAISNANQYFRNFSPAISYTTRSLDLSQEMGDVAGVMNGRYQLGEIYRFVNNSQKALDLYARDLPVANAYFPQLAQLWPRYFSISRTFDQLGLFEAAISFQNEALQIALDAQVPRLVCRSYNCLGLTFSKHGDYADASDRIERAIEIGDSFDERSVQIEAVAFSFLQLGYVYRKAGDFDKAIKNYDKAIQYYDELNSKFFVFTAHKDKLLCCMEQSGCSSVNQELKEVLNLFEEQREKILEESNRNTFFDAEQSIYDVAIEFEYKEHHPEKAFEYSERSRGRSLGDMASTSFKVTGSRENPDVKPDKVAPPPNLKDIQKGIPNRSLILQYAVLKNSILIWVVSNDDIQQAPQSIPIEDLNKKVGGFLELIPVTTEENLEAFRHEANDLYDLLIKPVENLLDGSKLLCIVPDKILNHLPFGALWSGSSGKYFIQEHAFVLSPSAQMFVMCSEAAQKKEQSKSEKLFSAGNPLIERKPSSGLRDLSSAAEEVEAIAKYYNPTPPLIGPAATKSRVVAGMEEADVIHLATHAVSDPWNPLRSKLLLAKDSPEAGAVDDGVLQASEIYNLNLARAKLVVLSACQTGVEKYYGGEGMIGLSRPFIAKRVPLVVASLWPVNSKETARLMIIFHRNRKSGDRMPTAQALANAQRAMIDSDGNNHLPCNWAAFVAIGGYTDF